MRFTLLGDMLRHTLNQRPPFLELSSRLAFNGKQAEKRMIFYLEQFPGDLAV